VDNRVDEGHRELFANCLSKIKKKAETLNFEMMICFPNAKINLGLNILSRRQDGFHQIETYLYPIPLFDVIEFKESDVFRLFNYGYNPGIPETDNLVYKAWQLLSRHFSIPLLEIHLIKNIPAGSGLGGGSADAAFLMKAANQYFSLGLQNMEMQQFVSQLGSDCSFFIQKKPAFASGRGEIIEPSKEFLKEFYLGLVFPDISLSTSETYKMVHPSKSNISLRKIITSPIEDWKDKLTNAFEKPVFQQFPELKKIKEILYSNGALYASLTGSGSCMYGIFKSKPEFIHSSFKYPSKILRL
jgi:4-diphosphocytidyl-2-C-methyl-D-erythritol kinase